MYTCVSLCPYLSVPLCLCLRVSREDSSAGRGPARRLRGVRRRRQRHPGCGRARAGPHAPGAPLLLLRNVSPSVVDTEHLTHSPSLFAQGIFLSDDDFHSLIRKVDTDGDGTISWAEFRDAFGLAGSGGKALPSGEMPGGIFYSAAGHSHSSPTYRTSVLSGAYRPLSAAVCCVGWLCAGWLCWLAVRCRESRHSLTHSLLPPHLAQAPKAFRRRIRCTSRPHQLPGREVAGGGRPWSHLASQSCTPARTTRRCGPTTRHSPREPSADPRCARCTPALPGECIRGAHTATHLAPAVWQVALQQAYHPLAERTPFGVDPSTGGTRGVSRGAPNRSRFSFSGAR